MSDQQQYRDQHARVMRKFDELRRALERYKHEPMPDPVEDELRRDMQAFNREINELIEENREFRHELEHQ
ncbi:hypothetical protein KC878_03525 [Candidatus Saccharibacteria bacterium]|nr:hypothetical protein [Candidatus Saccharibacteria bacterium]MCB9821398.1 hypothetical protein [Candidatus Nomurabacteria bacterium]